VVKEEYRSPKQNIRDEFNINYLVAEGISFTLYLSFNVCVYG